MDMNGKDGGVLREEFVRGVEEFVRDDAANRSAETGDRYFDTPLVRFASAHDPLFMEYKTVIGPEHFTPAEAFAKAHGDVLRREGTVISVALPFNEKIRASNRPMRDWPSREWILARSFGDPVVCRRVEAHLVDHVIRAGGRAVAPSRAEWFTVHRNAAGPYSVWSERHIAYAAGHGTFSLNDGFITERGMAVRFVSVATDLAFPPDRREASHYMANCTAVQ